MSRADCDVCDEHREKELRDLNKQIDILKAALISERAYICSANAIETMPMDSCFIGMAIEQLAKEYPEINWEE